MGQAGIKFKGSIDHCWTDGRTLKIVLLVLDKGSRGLPRKLIACAVYRYSSSPFV